MNAALLRVYHRLPAPARSAAAGLRGLYLRRWRYGPDSEALVAAALERDGWSAAQWRAHVEERLPRLLHRAATRVPYYRDQWARRRRAGDRASWEYLENWPVLAKETVRANPTAFVADDRRLDELFYERSSGSTGTPMRLWWSREAVRTWFAVLEARMRRWHGVDRRRPWAILGGAAVVPPLTQRPPYWVWNAPMRQLYLSANHVGRESARAYADAMRRRGVDHMIAYPASAAALAGFLADAGTPAEGLRVVLANAEGLLPWQREIIRRGLGCEARETYGMAEIVAAASECAHGTLHLWPEVGHLELLADDGRPAPVGTPGEVVGTGLLNLDMPLVRYAVGDRACLSPPTACGCGRALPALARVEGRVNDVLIAPDGRRVWYLNPIVYELPIREAQVIQEAPARIRVLVVPDGGDAAADQLRAALPERIRARLGDVEVQVEPVARVPREANGKYKVVVCRIATPEWAGGGARSAG